MGGAGRRGARVGLARATRFERSSLSVCSCAICWRNDWFSSRTPTCERCWMTRVVAAPVMTKAVRPSLSLVAAISFKMVRVVPAPVAAPVKAALEIATASPVGAAVTAPAVSRVPNTPTDKATPCCFSRTCNFSNARFTRTRAASWLLPNAAPTERKSRCSKKRSTIAVRSSLPS